MRAKRWGAAAMLAGLLVSGAARAEWKRAESEHFVVYGHGERAVRQYAGMLEDFDDLLRRLHGRPKDEVAVRKLPVYLVSDFRRSSGSIRSWTAWAASISRLRARCSSWRSAAARPATTT
jgi:hypothetical protein